jgi:hypothetical protein
VISTTMHRKNHEVSPTGTHCCGSNDVRGCHEESYNATPAYQARRLIIEWTAYL